MSEQEGMTAMKHSYDEQEYEQRVIRKYKAVFDDNYIEWKLQGVRSRYTFNIKERIFLELDWNSYYNAFLLEIHDYDKYVTNYLVLSNPKVLLRFFPNSNIKQIYQSIEDKMFYEFAKKI